MEGRLLLCCSGDVRKSGFPISTKNVIGYRAITSIALAAQFAPKQLNKAEKKES